MSRAFAIRVLSAVLVLWACAASYADAREDARQKVFRPRPTRAGPAEQITGGTVTGDLRRHPGVTSQFLEHKRDVFVWLPPGYATSGRRYPTG